MKEQVWNSAVRIFEISNWIVNLVFDSKRAQLFEIHTGVQENDVSVKMYVYSAVVNNGPGPVSPWSLYIGPLWTTKYWNSYNRNHNSAVP